MTTSGTVPVGISGWSYRAQTGSGGTGAFSTWRRQGRDVLFFFDNDEAGYAPRNAERLHSMSAH